MSFIKDNQNMIAILFYKNRRVHKLMNKDEIKKKIKMLEEVSNHYSAQFVMFQNTSIKRTLKRTLKF